MENFNFVKKYSFDELTSVLRNEQLNLSDWVTIFNRLYPKNNQQSSSLNTSFFAEELNNYRRSRLNSERACKLCVTAVMIAGLIWCTQLASTTIIGSASITIFILNTTFTYLSPIIFNPQIGFPEGEIKLSDNEAETWTKYRSKWLQIVERNQLSEQNESKQIMTRNLGIGLVLTFAVGITLGTHAVSVYLMANLITYAAGLVLGPDHGSYTEGYNDAPSSDFDYEKVVSNDNAALLI